MKTAFIRRFHRHTTAAIDGTFFKKRNGEQSFFSDETSHDIFFHPSSASAHASIQRKCEKCEEEDKKMQSLPEKNEEKLNRKEATSSNTVETNFTSNYISSFHGKGQPLSKQHQYFFESKMGYDFSNVKIHTGEDAVQSAKEVNAQAYTYGNHIIFNESKYQPETLDGQRLLAHELAHIVQQDQSTRRKIQRITPAGFEIRGVYPDAGSYQDTIFYEMGSAMIPSSEWYKLSGIAHRFGGKNITLTGSGSEEGDLASNTTLVNSRIAGVDRNLGRLGHTGLRSRNPQVTAATGNIDYRKVRIVEVIETPSVTPPGGIMPTIAPPCDVTLANPTPEVASCGSTFPVAFPFAIIWASIALSRISARDAAAVSQVAVLFPGIGIDVIEGHIRNIVGQIGRLPAQHRCHNDCDTGCTRPAYNRGTGSSSMMTLCPGFLTNTDITDNAQTLIHESLHATPGLATRDTAYLTTRLIENLTGAQAVNNTDSFVLLILRLSGVSPIPSPATDILSTLSIPEQSQARRALSFLEQWLLNADFDLGLVYSAMNRNIGSATGWAADDAYEASIVHGMAGSVGLTDPGASPFPNAPVTTDKVKIAGVWDRFNPMMRAIYMRNITVNKISSGTDLWAANMGNSVNVGSTFFSMSAEDSVKHLLRLLIISQGRVPSGVVNTYIEAANVVRRHRSTGP